MYSVKQSIEFEEFANPHSWFLVASELHEQAMLLRNGNSSIITRRSYAEQHEITWSTSNRTVILLAGFALENIIKAYLVYEHPVFVKNGLLSNKLRTHKLTNLAKQSSLLPYQPRSTNILRYYEDGLESWAR